MKKNNHFFYYVIILCLLLSGAYFFTNKKLENPSYESLKIGLLDGEKIWTELPVIKNLKKEMNSVLMTHHKRFSVLEKNLQKENQEIVKLQQNLQSQTQQQRQSLERRQKAFSDKVSSVQKEAEETQKKINDLYEKSMQIIRERTNQSIKKIAQKKNLSLVLYKNQAAHHEKALDITQDVFKDLESFQSLSLRG